MSQKEKNSIKDITEDDEETNLFRAEMMNFYKNKTEEELLNEKYRLEIKCMKMKIMIRCITLIQYQLFEFINIRDSCNIYF
mgnify:CR=1 FL=1